MMHAGTMLHEGHADHVILVASLLLLGFGLTMVLCASAGLDAGDRLFERQVMRAGIGLVALGGAYMIPRSWLPYLALAGIVFAFGLVILTLTPLGRGPEGQVSSRWLSVFGFVFQPSEILKLALVIHLARILSRRGARIKTFKGILAPLWVVILSSGLIAAQPNMGTAATLAIIGMTLVFLAGARVWHMVLAGLPVAAAALLRILSVPYERERLMTWVQGSACDLQREGYQVRQSLLAMASGGPFGCGFGESIQKFDYLPAAHTDFIFAIVGEEGGFVVSVAVLAIYALIVGRALRVAGRLEDSFAALVAAGIGIMLGVQVFLNVAVVTGLLPTTGLPLPFLSYGGSSLIVHLAAIGILLRLSREVAAQPEPESGFGAERALRCT